jgi:hypothetical protein
MFEVLKSCSDKNIRIVYSNNFANCDITCRFANNGNSFANHDNNFGFNTSTATKHLKTVYTNPQTMYQIFYVPETDIMYLTHCC